MSQETNPRSTAKSAFQLFTAGAGAVLAVLGALMLLPTTDDASAAPDAVSDAVSDAVHDLPVDSLPSGSGELKDVKALSVAAGPALGPFRLEIDSPSWWRRSCQNRRR